MLRVGLILLALISTIIAYELHANFLFSDVIGAIYNSIAKLFTEEQGVVAKPAGVALYDEDFAVLHVAFNFLVIVVTLVKERPSFSNINIRRKSAWYIALLVCLFVLNIQLLLWQY